MALKLTTSNGKTLLIEDKPFSSGGQGGVHYVLGNHKNKVAKIFHQKDSKKNSKIDKLEYRISFMVKNSPTKNSSKNIQNALVWPEELLYQNKKFVGFIMPMAGDTKIKDSPIKLTSLCKENLNWKLKNEVKWNKFQRTLPSALLTRLKLCYNIASAIHALHRANNYILVDLKPDNILINSNGWMSIIDLDSIQISKANKVLFQAEAFTQEYVPPEWQKNLTQLSNATKNKSWDRFCYGVLAYQLLLGIHPFTASHKNFHSPTEFIREGLFPNGRNKSEFVNIPPAHNYFNSLPPEIQSLFIRCFEIGYQFPEKRPTMEEWVNAIVNLLHKPPTIHFFKADKKTRDDSNPIILSWKVDDAEEIYLNGKHIKKKAQVSVFPNNDITYILTAKNKHKTLRSKLVIKVDKRPPKIIFFKSNKSMLLDHHPATIQWKTEKASHIVLSGVGDVSRKNSCSVGPKKDTDYVLTVTGHFGDVVKKKLSIRISKAPPKIIFFQTNISHREDDSKVYLTWKIENAHSIWISNVGDVSKLQRIEVDPKKDIMYNMEATSYFGQKTNSNLKITVSKKPPVINSFKIDTSFLNYPGPVKIQWQVNNAHSLILNPTGIVTGKKSVTDYPIKDTQYTLEATSYFGVTISKTIEVKTTKKPPQIKLESRRVSSFAQKKTIKLIWDVEWTKKTTFNQGIGDVKSKGNIEQSLDKDTNFTITAVSPFGVISTKSIDIKVIKKPLFNKGQKKSNLKDIGRNHKLNISNREWNKKK